MEWLHAKQNHQPGYQGNDDNPHNNSHLAPRNGREDLSAYQAVDHAVAQHDDNVEQAADLARVVAHKVSSYDLFTTN